MELLRADNLSKTFMLERGIFKRSENALLALDRVSLTLEPATVLGVVGESGSGKTTLGKIIARLLAPDSGEVIIEGRNVREYRRAELASLVQMIFQDPFASLNPKLTIGTMLSEAASLLPPAERTPAILQTLSIVGLEGNILSAYPHQFSGGQRQRIAIARALLRKPKIIIADEPLSALDITIQNQLLDVFIKLKQMHAISFIFISHDLTVTSNLADRLLVMKDGKVVEAGSTDNVIGDPREEYTKKLLAAVPQMNVY